MNYPFQYDVHNFDDESVDTLKFVEEPTDDDILGSLMDSGLIDSDTPLEDMLITSSDEGMLDVWYDTSHIYSLIPV